MPASSIPTEVEQWVQVGDWAHSLSNATPRGAASALHRRFTGASPRGRRSMMAAMS